MEAGTVRPLADPRSSEILQGRGCTPDRSLPLTPGRVGIGLQDSRDHCCGLGNDTAVELEGAVISRQPFNELQASAPARAALWQQICTHEHDFYPQHD